MELLALDDTINATSQAEDFIYLVNCLKDLVFSFCTESLRLRRKYFFERQMNFVEELRGRHIQKPIRTSKLICQINLPY